MSDGSAVFWIQILYIYSDPIAPMWIRIRAVSYGYILQCFEKTLKIVYNNYFFNQSLKNTNPGKIKYKLQDGQRIKTNGTIYFLILILFFSKLLKFLFFKLF